MKLQDTQKQNEKKERREDIQRIVLSCIATAGIITIAVLAPNALQMFRPFMRTHRRYRSPAYVTSVAGKLAAKGFINFEKKGGSTFMRITEQGKQELLRRAVHEQMADRRHRKWDGKWRMIIFDIKEYKKGIREKVRRELVGLGFSRLQDSVWVYPYDCEDVAVLLKADARIGGEVRYVVAEKIEYDQALRQYFKVK